MTSLTDLKESHLRSVLKALTYRIVGTLTTGVLAFAVSRDVTMSLTIAGLEPLVKTVVYYLHERAWQQVPRGRIRRLIRSQ